MNDEVEEHELVEVDDDNEDVTDKTNVIWEYFGHTMIIRSKRTLLLFVLYDTRKFNHAFHEYAFYLLICYQ